MKKATHITFILDRSGSMQSIREDTIGGFNTFLKTQQAVPDPCTFTLAQFDSGDAYDVVRDCIHIADVAPLDGETFVPRGGTPLYDAIGRGINETGAMLSALPEEERPEKVLFVILTDGEENQSREFTQADIFKMITDQEKAYDWEFVFLAANQDALSVGAGMGIKGGSSCTFAATSIGTRTIMGTVSEKMSSYRMSATVAEAKAQPYFSEADRKKQDGELSKVGV